MSPSFEHGTQLSDLHSDSCTLHIGPEVNKIWEAHGIVMCPLPPHSLNQVQPLDLSTFRIAKRWIIRINRIETVNIQSSHMAEVVSAFMPASSPLNAVGTFRSIGIMLWLAPDNRLCCGGSAERARCLTIAFIPVDVKHRTT
jgi:hypothetical protein